MTNKKKSYVWQMIIVATVAFGGIGYLFGCGDKPLMPEYVSLSLGFTFGIIFGWGLGLFTYYFEEWLSKKWERGRKGTGTK